MNLERKQIEFNLDRVCLRNSTNQFGMLAYDLVEAGFDIEDMICKKPHFLNTCDAQTYFKAQLIKGDMKISLEAKFVDIKVKLTIEVKDNDIDNIEHFIESVRDNLTEFEMYHIEKDRRDRQRRSRRQRPVRTSSLEDIL